MSDQHAAAALTAAAVITSILVARAAILHQGHRRHAARPAHLPHRRTTGGTVPTATAPADDAATLAVRAAEKHVHLCWQQLHTHADPPE